MWGGEDSDSGKATDRSGEHSDRSELPSNVNIICWADGGPAFRYSDLSTAQKRNLIQVFQRVGEACDKHWSWIRFFGIVDESVELVDSDHPDREYPRDHPAFVLREPPERIDGERVVVAPGVSFQGMSFQGNWISIDQELLVDCTELESEDPPDIQG